ncbi:hypothetical protein L602_001500000860 [Cupriavidus gilardii J11]|uniref:Trypsin-like peptidase n=1 Tax=Cupriavidus gilardii J11 TaxID=936133 RepID=A0A562BT79_9BURK|nr:hypothetical protein [Cupriavidus gilardii]TWG87953.1 hypothetical protein L602_001500000860 [Cupriavidus gilardii J11]
MTTDTTSDKICIHDDLEDGSGQVNSYRFCIPIYITNSFGLNLRREGDLIATAGQQPKVRSGTLTFVQRDNQVYGITCRHVLDALEKEEASFRKTLPKIVPPVGGFLGFRYPTLTEQIHINAKFYPAWIDNFTDQGKDLAIARITSETFAKIGREAIPFNRIGMPPDNSLPHLGGIATGFPEQSRISRKSDGNVQKLSMPTVVAVAPFEAACESSLRLQAELESLPEANNLSGMSGGPILWTCRDGWGLAGIVTEGWDIHPTSATEAITPIHEHPKIHIKGEPLTSSIIDELISVIPDDDPAVPYFETKVYPLARKA